jgi:hypothetical protein
VLLVTGVVQFALFIRWHEWNEEHTSILYAVRHVMSYYGVAACDYVVILQGFNIAYLVQRNSKL